MKKQIIILVCFIVTILLSIGTISANDDLTDSYVSIPIDDVSDISCSPSDVELSKDLESSDCNIYLNVSNNSKVSMSGKESLESENSLSTNHINNTSNIGENKTNNSVISSLNSNNIISVSSTIISKNVTKYYNEKTPYTAKFLNIQNQALANKDISINVNGKSCTVKTNNDGLASLDINFKPGTYQVTAKNPDTGYMVTNTFTILSTINAKDLVKLYKDNRKFSAKFLKSNGKVLSKKIIKFKIGKKIYKVKTNKKGIARLSLNSLKKGTYKIISYNIDGLKKTNTIKVLTKLNTTIITKNYTYLKNESKVIKVRVKTSLGTTVGKNNLVTFKVDGKSYQSKTNKKGIAKVTLGKLNKGLYTIEYKFYKNGHYKASNASNKLLIFDNNTVTYTVKSNTTFIKGQNESFKVALTAGGIALSNRTVTVTLNNTAYIKTTDDEGSISVPINLTEGNYTIEYSYNGEKKIKPKTGFITIQVKSGPAKKIPVLVFHRIVPDDVKNAKYPDNEWVASESVFADMMKYIYDNNYNVISIEEFNEWYDGKIEYPEKTIVITIDDGYLTDYAIAYPILKKYNFKFTSFIIGSKVKEKTIDCNYTTLEDYEKYPYAFMGKDIIDKIHDEYPNWSFQGHSYNLHYKVNETVAINLKTPDELREDFEKLSERFKFNILAYPYGVHNDDAKKMLNETGYTIAFRFGPPKYATRNDDRYAISRVKINSYMDVDDLAKWLTV